MGRRCHVVIGMLLALLFVSGCATTTTLVRLQPTRLPTATAQPPNPFPLTAPLDPPPTTCTGTNGDDATKPAPAGTTTAPDSHANQT